MTLSRPASLIYTAASLLLCAAITPALSEPPRVREYVLDFSASMADKLGTDSRADVLRRALHAHLQALSKSDSIAVRLFGHRVSKDKRKQSCNDTELISQFGVADPSAVGKAIRPLLPLGLTSLARSLEEAGQDLLEREGSRSIVLLSDGEDTCGGDPAAVIASLKTRGLDVAIHTIGFLPDSRGREQLKRVAGLTGGRYFTAQNELQLVQSLNGAGSASRVPGDLGGWQDAGSDAAGALALPDGRSGECRLGGSDSKDQYYIDAKEGEKLQLRAVPKSGGLRISLLAPGGRTLAEASSGPGAPPAEIVVQVEESGAQLVSVELSKGATESMYRLELKRLVQF